MSKTVAVQLLKANAKLDFGHFCTMSLGGDEMICVRATQILETMEVEEFQQNCLNVARLADAWEEKIGKNEF
jgi:succinyl-CoA synthetase alpha subunit